MQIDGAVIKEQGVKFAIVTVKMSVFGSAEQRDQIQRSCSVIFPGMPIVLMAQDAKGRPKYYGRTDIVKFLAHVHPSRIPWKRYTIT